MSTDLDSTVEERLRGAGQRYTPQRRDLMHLLAQAASPVSIPQILADADELKQSSVYRNLAALEQAGVVRRVPTDEEYGRYELAEELIGHHHHLVCSNCGAMRDVEVPADVLKDPFVLEFLGLDEQPHWRERDLEQAIIDRIEGFLLELGKGFCFVARQKRVTLEGDHFYVDLVFYNRLLRCFVLVDLKLGKLTHQDLGQMQMYVNFFDRFQRAEHEAKTIGIVLCSEKNDAMAKITLPENNEQILAARYQMYLPTEEELRAELAREREAAERALRLAADVKVRGDG